MSTHDALGFLRDMLHNCINKHNYEDPLRYKKAQALGMAIDLMEQYEEK
jgi:hypothetical protein